MSTLVQIETAVDGLSLAKQWRLLEWLQERLNAASAPSPKPCSEALNAFRQLQREVGLTTEGAAAWKAAVNEARR
jgi:hypothetical protein